MAEQQACLDHAELYLLELCVIYYGGFLFICCCKLQFAMVDNGIGRYFRGFVDMKLQLPRFWREYHLESTSTYQ
jgi:hypothetical protein